MLLIGLTGGIGAGKSSVSAGLAERGAVDNFASFLRVCCGRYLALQLSGGIPQNPAVSIRSLDAQQVLGTLPCPTPAAARGIASSARPVPITLTVTGLARRAVLRWSAQGMGWQVVPDRHLYPAGAMAA